VIEPAPRYEDISAAKNLDEKTVSIDIASSDEIIVTPLQPSDVILPSTSARREGLIDNLRLVVQTIDDRRVSHLAR